MQSAHVHKHTPNLSPKHTCPNTSSLHTQTHKNTQNGSKVNPVDKEILQLCIKEDTEASNYSNCASCHNSNMAVHMLYSINQESATCLPRHRAVVWWLAKIIYPDKISHNSKAKKNWSVHCEQQIPLECIECIYNFSKLYFVCCHQVGCGNNLAS